MNLGGTLNLEFSPKHSSTLFTPSREGMLSYSPITSITTIIALSGRFSCQFFSSVCLRKSGESLRYAS